MNTEPRWLHIAKQYKNVKEAPGAADNKVILSWADRIGGWVKRFYSADSIPWCGLFVGNVMLEAGIPAEELPKNPLSALAWNSFGRKLVGPRLGCLLVFRRKGGGHVGFYIGEDDTHYHVLGGNQSDAVNVMRIQKDRLEGMRWPNGHRLPVVKIIRRSPSDVNVSTNEV